MATTRYQPFKIIHNKPHPICTMTFPTENEALEYGYSRGLQRSEIYIKSCIYEGDEWNVHIDFSNIYNDNE